MSDPDLTPAQEESVRALLASARHTEPAPPHVVARLDETLADLVTERREVRTPVVTLASRRRRLTSNVLLAAAAVVVLGVGVTQILTSASDSSDNTSAGSSAGSFEDQAGAPTDRAFGADELSGPESSDLGDQSQRSTQEKTPLAGAAEEDLSALTSSRALKAQVRALRPPAASTSSLSALGCLIDRTESEDQVSITYDQVPGVLVYRAPVSGRQQVDVYLCGEGDPQRSVQIPAR